MICLLSILVVFSAEIADHLEIKPAIPEISSDSIETLLVISASMLPIAVFTVSAMLSAYTFRQLKLPEDVK
jgi:anaerobic C4-dicarboxylate transporter